MKITFTHKKVTYSSDYDNSIDGKEVKAFLFPNSEGSVTIVKLKINGANPQLLSSEEEIVSKPQGLALQMLGIKNPPIPYIQLKAE